MKVASVVWRLVPYWDARFNAAAKQLDLHVIELFDQSGDVAWSTEVVRNFGVTATNFSPQKPFSREDGERLHNTLDQLSPDVVTIQGWGGVAYYSAALWAKKNQCKLVVFSESNAYDHRRVFWAETFKKVIIKACDAALVGGQDHLEYMKMLGMPENAIFKGHNAIDNAHFERLEKQAWPTSPYFLVSSRLVENKNIETILKSYTAYRNSCNHDPWEMVVLGTGPLEDNLKALAHGLEIEEHVRFEGFRKYHELPGLYHNAGCLVHAATWEPWGLVVNEACAAGLPVIVSSPTGCTGELIKEGENGYTFDPMDAERLSELMQLISSNMENAKSMGKRSIEIVSDWGPERFGNGLAGACDTAMRAPKKRSLVARFMLEVLSKGYVIKTLSNVLNNWGRAQNRKA